MGWLPWLECCNQGVQALQEGQAGKIRKGSCPLCEGIAEVHRALPGGG